MEHILEKWHEFLEFMERSVSAVSFDLWIRTLRPIDIINDDTMIIATGIEGARENILKNRSVLTHFEIGFNRFYPTLLSFKFLAYKEDEAYLRDKGLVMEKKEEEKKKSQFNPKYTFESFVVGKNSNVVHAAAMAVAERPGTQFNPLFIYGGTGLGKTHLLHAIGNELEANKPGLKIHYTTCENFVNDYVNAIRQGAEKTNKVFRNKYRTLDVLMIDDIQFLINKHGTQEEFFHTFNDLYKNNSQIIVVSDRTPKELDTLEDRIKSRLSSGLIQDVQSPDYETRLAILMKKRDEEKLNVDDKALMVISQTVDSHVRDLEGFLTKTAFLAKIDGSKTATEHHAIDATRDFVSKAGCTQDNTPKALIEIIANYFRIKSSDMVGKRKNKEFVEARQIAMYFITEYFEDMPLLAVGKLFGNTDHTTVIYSRDKVKKEKAINHEFRKRIEEIEEQTKPQFTK